MWNASLSSGAKYLSRVVARSAAPLNSPGEGVAHAVALRHGNGTDACVEIWFAGTYFLCGGFLRCRVVMTATLGDGTHLWKAMRLKKK